MQIHLAIKVRILSLNTESVYKIYDSKFFVGNAQIITLLQSPNVIHSEGLLISRCWTWRGIVIVQVSLPAVEL